MTFTLTVGMTVVIAGQTYHDGGSVVVTHDNFDAIAYGIRVYGWWVNTMVFDYSDGYDHQMRVLAPADY